MIAGLALFTTLAMLALGVGIVVATLVGQRDKIVAALGGHDVIVAAPVPARRVRMTVNRGWRRAAPLLRAAA